VRDGEFKLDLKEHTQHPGRGSMALQNVKDSQKKGAKVNINAIDIFRELVLTYLDTLQLIQQPYRKPYFRVGLD
jgi:hypothetical protein